MALFLPFPFKGGTTKKRSSIHESPAMLLGSLAKQIGVMGFHLLFTISCHRKLLLVSCQQTRMGVYLRNTCDKCLYFLNMGAKMQQKP